MTQPAAATTTHNELGVRIRVYEIPHPDTGELLKLPNISSVVDVLQTWGLADWKLRMAAAGIVSRTDLQARVAVALPMEGGRDRNRQILDAVEDAIAHGQTIDPDRGYLANDLGTAVHFLTEHLDNGLVDDVMNLPNSVVEYAANYVQLMAAHGVQVVESEFTVIGPGYAGTGDRIVAFDRPPATGNEAVFDQLDLGRGLFVLDIKTGRVSPKAAMQLAALANADGIWDAEAEAHRCLPDDLRTDIGFLLHLTAEGADLIPVDLADAWPAFTGALAVKTFADSKPLHPALVAPARPAYVAEAHELAEQARQAAADLKAAEGGPSKVTDLMDQLAASVDASKAARAEHRAKEAAEATDLLEAMGEAPTGVPAAYEVPSIVPGPTTPPAAPREPDPGDLEAVREAFDAAAEPTHISDTLKLAIAAIPDDPDAGTVNADGQVAPDLAERTAWLASRLADLIGTHGDTIPLAWPDGVPSFKANRENGELHTGEQLDAIERAIADVERTLAHPFPDPDPSTVGDHRVAADDPRVTDITERFASLPIDIRDEVAAAAEAAGVKRFSQGSGTEQCVATWHRLLDTAEPEAAKLRDRISNAAGVLAGHDQNISTDWLLTVVGNYTATLTRWQADRLDELADALGLDFLEALDGELQLSATGKAHLETEFGGKTGIRKAARMTADLWGIEAPAKADDVYANPLLAACLCMSESEPTPISSPNPAA